MYMNNLCIFPTIHSNIDFASSVAGCACIFVFSRQSRTCSRLLNNLRIILSPFNSEILLKKLNLSSKSNDYST
uniref:Uncharacterized protein n=1 Tax=Populus trichocarpa TaxID=3694 RepID=A0A2K2A3N6_POPTR